MTNSWEAFPDLGHIENLVLRTKTERRKRHKDVRYLIFRLQTASDQSQPVEGSADYPPGFVNFWLSQKPLYAIGPKKEKIPVPSNKSSKTVLELGGYSTFAKTWDVDSDLNVYLRHSSIWQEWNATMMRVVPELGE